MKYHNSRTVVDNIKFDSKKEASRYLELKMLEKAKKISNLELQVPFEIVPAIKINGRTNRKVVYVADFVYFDENGKRVVEDVKGVKTEVYKLKKKLMAWIHNVDILET